MILVEYLTDFHYKNKEKKSGMYLEKKKRKKMGENENNYLKKKKRKKFPFTHFFDIYLFIFKRKRPVIIYLMALRFRLQKTPPCNMFYRGLIGLRIVSDT